MFCRIWNAFRHMPEEAWKAFLWVSFLGAERGGNLRICSSAHKTKAKVMIFRQISLIKVKFSLILILLRGFMGIGSPF